MVRPQDIPEKFEASAKASNQPQTSAQSSAFAVPIDKCQCDPRGLECLPATECLQGAALHDQHNIALGAAVRKKLKKSVTFQNRDPFFIPVGKCFQYNTIKNWKSWVALNVISFGFVEDLRGTPGLASAWQNYEFCRNGNRTDLTCFFNDLPHDESPSIGSLIDLAGEQVPEEEVDQSITNLYRVRHHEGLPIDSLLSFAHILRMQFNLQPSITDAITKHAAQTNPGKGTLRVSLHVRRADACEHIHDQKDDHYAGASSTVESGPQPSGRRHCYKTSVYTDKLNEIYQRYKMPLDVYLSTDDSASVLDEIRETNPTLYEKTNFRFSNYSRSSFEYEGMIESPHDKHGFMTESSLVDLWTLSHGQIFVGSLGSRFGKVAYLLATAHHNRPIPFVSVDGHSLCCEIDEDCTKATKAMKTMEDCLTFAHELSSKPINEDYWTVGSTIRYK